MAATAGYGGEVGHMVVNPDKGRPCGCGAHGCLETEVGRGGAAGGGGPRGSGYGRGRRPRRGRRRRPAATSSAQARPSRVGDWLGFGVANLVNLFNPEMVIFGGGLREVYLGSAAQVRSRLDLNALPPCREQVRLRTSALGEDAALVGAAELAFSQVLADPLEVLARAGS